MLIGVLAGVLVASAVPSCCGVGTSVRSSFVQCHAEAEDMVWASLLCIIALEALLCSPLQIDGFMLRNFSSSLCAENKNLALTWLCVQFVKPPTLCLSYSVEWSQYDHSNLLLFVSRVVESDQCYLEVASRCFRKIWKCKQFYWEIIS